MKPRWKVVKCGTYWKIEMKMNEEMTAILRKGRTNAERGLPVWRTEEEAQAVADDLNNRMEGKA